MRHRVQLLSAVAVLFAVSSGAGAQGIIQYDRNAPEIRSFRATSPGGESSVGGSRVRSLDLPVLDFKEPPVAGAAGFESTVTARRGIPIYDPSSRATYAIRHVYEGVTILISADLRYISSSDTAQQSPPLPDRSIEVGNSNDDDGLMAWAIERRFGVPYTIYFECPEQKANICRDRSEIEKILNKLQLVSVPREG